ncbi:MAG: hypothetical protein CHACPFDD_03239 [Phycisphaerae bacterium]|nr:hypothetical protein [Phycisphaerae bacterium]
MLRKRYLPLVAKQVLRNPTRSVLTMCGVAVAMFLYTTVQAMQAGVEAATRATAADNTLIVYRKDRFCPFTSRMPQSYEQRIAKIPGVASVMPMKITVSNCRTSLDVVTFRGVEDEAFQREYTSAFTVVAGSLAEWLKRSDGVLLGETLASRRGLKVGDRFDAVGITAYVAGVIRSAEPQHQNVAYAHLSFLQFASGSRQGGIVTQFNVRVTDPALLDSVAAAIDAEFASDQEPTTTRSEKAFVAHAASDILEIVRFAGWMGWGCLAAVLALVGNSIVLAVQDRIREHAVLQTLGFRGGLIARLIMTEGALMSLVGGLGGCGAALAVLHWRQLAISMEGLSIPISASAGVLGTGLLVALLLGVAAGLVPAWQASRREIVACFRAV